MASSTGNFRQRNKLTPLNELDKNNLDLLYQQAEIKQLQPRTLITVEPKQLVYLLEGEVSILSGGFVVEKFSHLEQRALSPLFNETLDEDSSILTSHGTILVV